MNLHVLFTYLFVHFMDIWVESTIRITFVFACGIHNFSFLYQGASKPLCEKVAQRTCLGGRLQIHFAPPSPATSTSLIPFK